MPSPPSHLFLPMYGKRTEKASTSLTVEELEDVDRKAHSLGMDRATFIREAIRLCTYGKEAVMTMHARRLDLMAGSGAVEDQA